MVRQYATAATEAGDILAKFGIVTDSHMADKNVLGDRNYRDADEKMADAVDAFNADATLDFVVHLGDMVDGYDGTDSAQGLIDFNQINAVYAQLNAPRHYCLGSNHDAEERTKAEIVAISGIPNMYYSFDAGDLHCVILDCAYNSYDDGDGFTPSNLNWLNGAWVSPTQIAWLRNDLATTEKQTVVFSHFRLDGYPVNAPTLQVVRGYQAFNADIVRSILTRSGKVRHVFTGHEHDIFQTNHNHVLYHGMEAMTENAYPENAYSIVTVYDNGWINVDGLGTRQTSYDAVVRMPL
jgi:alkaline phosphatase